MKYKTIRHESTCIKDAARIRNLLYTADDTPLDYRAPTHRQLKYYTYIILEKKTGCKLNMITIAKINYHTVDCGINEKYWTFCWYLSSILYWLPWNLDVYKIPCNATNHSFVQFHVTVISIVWDADISNYCISITCTGGQIGHFK